MSLRLRHGGNVSAPPSPDQIYGPTYGAASVRGQAGVRAAAQRTAVPSGAISFDNTTNLNTLVNAYPWNTAFVGAAGTYSNVALRPGNIYEKHPRFWFQDGAVIDGGGQNLSWIDTDWGYETSPYAGCEIRGGYFKNWGNLDSEQWRSVFIVRGPSAAEDIEVENCYSFAMPTSVSYCYVHDNIRNAYLGSGSTAPCVTLSYCHFKNNNTGHFDPAGATGEAGFKILGNSPWIHHNWVEGTWGPGIWVDFSYNDVLIEENVVENNTHWGIFYEVGTAGPASGFQARGIIRHNALYGNGTHGWSEYTDAQILVSCTDGYLNGGTQGFQISNNLIDGDRLAVLLIDHSSHPTDTKGGLVYRNEMWLRGTKTGVVGAYSGEDDDIYGLPANNRFRENHYHVPDDAAARWHWAGTYAYGSDKTWAQWRAYGQDVAGGGYGAGSVTEDA